MRVIVGLEYVKSPSGCRVSELSERTMDIDDNGMLAQPLDFLLPEALDMDFAFYRNVSFPLRVQVFERPVFRVDKSESYQLSR